MKPYLLNAIVFTLFAIKSATAQPPADKGYTLLFSENFAGNTLNEANWRYRIDRRTGYGYMDGLNLKENVYVKDSALHVVLKRERINGKLENTGGGVISKHNFGYGYYECLSKPFMAGHGVHSSFWQRGGANPNNNIFEIDSYEIDAGTWVATNNLYVDLAPNKTLKYTPWPHRAQVPFTFRPDGWFLDAYEFTPEGVIFYDNGKVVAKAEYPELNAHQMVWLTALNGVGKVDSTAFPAETVYKYFRYYAKDYPGVTILPNGNFEYNTNRTDLTKPVCWLPVGTEGAVMVVAGNTFRDGYKLRIGHGAKHTASVTQTLEYIMNGTYQLTAQVRSSGGQKQALLQAYGFGGKETSIPILKADQWTSVSLPVQVVNNTVTIAVTSDGEADQWLEIDDIKFMKPLPKGQKPTKPEPHLKPDAPIWQLAIREPIEFTGDQKFYFFDRNVGFGDSITVAFNVNANEQANMVPIARIPKSGTSGWAMQLKADGGLIFRIGSVENHSDVVADGIYKPGQVSSIKCVFQNGTASIFHNGALVKTETGIRQNTKDATAAGRLGTVGPAFEAVGDVVIEVGKSERETVRMKNFRGTLQHVRIYNGVK
jgi:hypothetical protein